MKVIIIFTLLFGGAFAQTDLDLVVNQVKNFDCAVLLATISSVNAAFATAFVTLFYASYAQFSAICEQFRPELITALLTFPIVGPLIAIRVGTCDSLEILFASPADGVKDLQTAIEAYGGSGEENENICKLYIKFLLAVLGLIIGQTY